MNNPQSHGLSLKLIQKCPACNVPFEPGRIRILLETDFSVLAHLHCANCQVNLLANVVNVPQGMVGNAILTDLQPEEASGFLEETAISEDEFLGLYQQVHNKQFLTNVSQTGVQTA